MSSSQQKSHGAGKLTNLEPPVAAELTLELGDLSQLFNAPRVDPRSHRTVEAGGIAGVDYMLGLLHMDPLLQRTQTLVLLLPAEKASSISPEETTRGIRRHVQFRIERERRELRNTYRYGWKVSVFAVVMLAVCIALSSIFSSEVTDWMRPLLRKTFEYGFEIIGWVILWHPIDVLVFSPVSIRARLAALEALGATNVVVRPDPMLDTTAMPNGSSTKPGQLNFA